VSIRSRTPSAPLELGEIRPGCEVELSPIARLNPTFVPESGFASRAEVEQSVAFLRPLLSQDVNGDGIADTIFARGPAQLPNPSPEWGLESEELWLSEVTDDGVVFHPTHCDALDAIGEYEGYFSVDVDGDGTLDLVATRGNGFRVFRNGPDAFEPIAEHFWELSEMNLYGVTQIAFAPVDAEEGVEAIIGFLGHEPEGNEPGRNVSGVLVLPLNQSDAVPVSVTTNSDLGADSLYGTFFLAPGATADHKKVAALMRDGTARILDFAKAILKTLH
jgi:hypothetical protein